MAHDIPIKKKLQSLFRFDCIISPAKFQQLPIRISVIISRTIRDRWVWVILQRLRYTIQNISLTL